MLIRRSTQTVDIDNVSPREIIKWCTILKSQVVEELRVHLDDATQHMNLAVLIKILERLYDEYITKIKPGDITNIVDIFPKKPATFTGSGLC